MNKITLVKEARNKAIDRQFKDNPLLEVGWEIVTLSDPCGLFCVLTPSILMLRLFDDHIGSIYYEHLDELFDVSRMCERIELDASLSLEPSEWCDLLESAVIHKMLDAPLVRSVF